MQRTSNDVIATDGGLALESMGWLSIQ